MQPKPANYGGNLLALPEGQELVGDYRIKRVLGAGGFGITYLADEKALARLVTIKEYFPADFAARDGDIDASPRSRECASDYKWGLDRFIEEAQTLARFVHPNIVRVYRYFLANNTGYMVLQFEEGGSFKSWLKGLKRAPRQTELDTIIAPLLDALEMVHKGDFLHRDIAPDNIIIRSDGSPVLIDFGSARGDIASHSKTVSALVKPGYSPYEQYATNSRQQGPWTDIYALGATLYHAVAGKRPPDAPSRMVNDEYVPARDAALSSYRPSFLAAIDKAMQLEIGERPQSIAAWRGMLLAPEPKRGRGGAGLRNALGRLRTHDPEPLAEVAPAVVPLADKARAAVPAPPDAPQKKGQLLDFIEGLKKHRPAAKPPRKLAAALKKVQPVAEAPAERAPPAKPKPSMPRDEPQSKSVARPPPRVLKPTPAERRAPRPRRLRGFGVPSRKWRSLAYKLLIGLGIAALAVAYQDKPPQTQVQGRGGSVVSSQTADLAQLGQLTGHKGAVTAVGFADQGRIVASVGADATLRVWLAATGALQRTIELDDGAATALAVSASDRRALTGHKSGTIVLWDLERAEKLAQFQHGEMAVSSLAFLNDAGRFTATNAGGAIALFDVRTPSSAPVALEAQDGAAQTGLMAVAARGRGLIAYAGQDRSVRLWQIDGGRGRGEAGRLQRTWRAHDAAISALDITSGGYSVVSGGADGQVRLWSTGSTRSQRSLRLHEGRITALAFAPNDRLIASAGEDGIVKLWDPRSGAAPRALRAGAAPVNALAFSADGRRVYAAGNDGTVRIWSTTPPGPSSN